MSIPKATYMAWKEYVPLKYAHGGKLWDFEVEPEGQPTSARWAQMPQEMEPLIPQYNAVLNHGEIIVEVLQK